jgi:hypothetical protein
MSAHKFCDDMQTAPRDGTSIEIKHGPQQEIVLARWSRQAQAWVKTYDPEHKTLHRVAGWRPALAQR